MKPPTTAQIIDAIINFIDAIIFSIDAIIFHGVEVGLFILSTSSYFLIFSAVFLFEKKLR